MTRAIALFSLATFPVLLLALAPVGCDRLKASDAVDGSSATAVPLAASKGQGLDHEDDTRGLASVRPLTGLAPLSDAGRVGDAAAVSKLDAATPAAVSDASAPKVDAGAIAPIPTPSIKPPALPTGLPTTLPSGLKLPTALPTTLPTWPPK